MATDWSKVKEDYARLGTASAVAREYGVKVSTVQAHLAEGDRVCVYFRPPLAARRKAVRDATKLPDMDIYEHGLLFYENQLDMIRRHAETRRLTCPHPQRYPNGRCRHCYEPQVSFAPPKPFAGGPLFRSAAG